MTTPHPPTWPWTKEDAEYYETKRTASASTKDANTILAKTLDVTYEEAEDMLDRAFFEEATYCDPYEASEMQAAYDDYWRL